MKSLKLITRIFCAAALMLALSVGTASAIVLPDPGTTFTCITDIGCVTDAQIDGLPVAYLHDEMLTYSAKLLDAMQDRGFVDPATYGTFDFPTGTGGLDVILYTGAGTKNRNQGVGPGGAFNFEDPVSAPSGSVDELHGWWGMNDQDADGTSDAVNGGVTVEQLYNYLDAYTGGTSHIPGFYMDMNQIGQTNSFAISGQVFLADPADPLGDNTIGIDSLWWTFDEWQMTLTPGDGQDDSIPNHQYDPAYPTFAPGEVTYPGTSGDYVLDHNLGSGKPDYIGYFPTLNLQTLMDDGYGWAYIVIQMDLYGLNDGFEEIFLTGLETPNYYVPEPATMLLLGTGLVGVAGAVRRRKRSV